MGACYCDGLPSVIRVATRKARKPHKCGECGRLIQPGETYEHVWGVWDGRPDTFKTCSGCVGLRDYVTTHVPCFCWQYEHMLEDATETLREYAHEVPGLWFGGARLLVKINNSMRGTGGRRWHMNSSF